MVGLLILTTQSISGEPMNDIIMNNIELVASGIANKGSHVILNGKQIDNLLGFSMTTRLDGITEFTMTIQANINTTPKSRQFIPFSESYKR